MKTAIIDLGTNTFHLLLVDIKNGTWSKILHKRITVKLGERGIDKKLIARSPFNRGLKALQIFRETINQHKIHRIFAFGTAALRTASNGQIFLEEIKKNFKINVKLISGEREAELIYFGVRQAVFMNTKPSLIMDIGGGSVEFIIANGKKIFWKKSYKLGAALLLDKFKPSDPITKNEVREITDYLDVELQSLFNACEKFKPEQLIGSAGSFETFASMIRYRFPDSGTHYGKTEHPIALAHFNKLYREIIHSNLKQRKTMKGLVKMRVDMIVLASLLLNFVLTETKIKKIRLSSYSLKEGILFDVIQKAS